MTDDLSWITGLMRANYEAVGFIPEPTLQERYLKNGLYVMQHDERGGNVGYLLHGVPKAGKILVVSQHCIDVDERLKGYGQEAFEVLLERAKRANCRAIKLRCAEGLPSNEFWRKMGLRVTRVIHPANARKRAVNVMMLDLWPMLFEVDAK